MLQETTKKFTKLPVVEVLGKETVDRLYFSIALESERRDDIIWSAPRKWDELSLFYNRFQINRRWKFNLDPVIIASPRHFVLDTAKEELAPSTLYRGYTEIYIGKDKESLTVKYPLPKSEVEDEQRVDYLIIETFISEYRELLKLLLLVEDKVHLFPNEVTTVTVEELKKILE